MNMSLSREKHKNSKCRDREDWATNIIRNIERFAGNSSGCSGGTWSRWGKDRNWGKRTVGAVREIGNGLGLGGGESRVSMKGEGWNVSGLGKFEDSKGKCVHGTQHP